jgi:hypothetical protein
MKVKAHIRVGRKPESRKGVVAANVKPTLAPLTDSHGPLATVAFAVVFDIPDSLFTRAENVIAEITVDGRKAKIATEIETP